MMPSPEFLLTLVSSVLFLCLTYIAIHFFKLSFVFTESKRDGTRNDIDQKAYIFDWKIQNLQYSQFDEGYSLLSPTFVANKLGGTKWSLILCPNTLTSSVVARLKRENDNFGPETIEVSYQLGFLEKYCSNLEDEQNIENGYFYRDKCDYNFIFKYRKEVFDTKRIVLMPEDTLTIQCKLWKGDEMPVATQNLSARTVFNRNERHFIWKIEHFSTLEPGIRSDFTVMNELEEVMIHFYLVINKVSFDEIEMEINDRIFDNRLQSYSLKVSIVDAKGEILTFGHKTHDGRLKTGFLLCLFTECVLIENSDLYLPNDVLSLDCELVYTTVTALYEGATRRTLTSVNRDTVRNGNEANVREEKAQIPSLLLDDLKSMYSKAICSDMELFTSTKTFPVHKSILSARSTVFKKIFNCDMKERNSEHVAIVDLEDETLQKMLTYIYTDTVEDLGMESASKLYSAADKYNIPSLKGKCSSFLKDNLCPNAASDVLILAERHQDHDLESVAKEYIMKPTKKYLSSKIKNVSWPPNFNN